VKNIKRHGVKRKKSSARSKNGAAAYREMAAAASMGGEMTYQRGMVNISGSQYQRRSGALANWHHQ